MAERTNGYTSEQTDIVQDLAFRYDQIENEFERKTDLLKKEHKIHIDQLILEAGQHAFLQRVVIFLTATLKRWRKHMKLDPEKREQIDFLMQYMPSITFADSPKGEAENATKQ